MNCRANQLPGFCMMTTLAFNELKSLCHSNSKRFHHLFRFQYIDKLPKNLSTCKSEECEHLHSLSL